jgi:ATP-binding cassette, subfamily B, bacterial
MRTDSDERKISLGRLLRPHAAGLAVAIVAVIVEGGASLAEPWPLKLVLDTVLKAKPGGRWLHQMLAAAGGTDKLAMLRFAAIAVLVIAAVGAVSSYTERYLTTTVASNVMHNLRQKLYSHVQRLSLGYHDRKYTGDLIGRLTSDIDSIQSFIASGLLGALVSSVTLVGMIVLMFYLNWRFTLIAVSVAPLLFVVIFHYTRRIKTGSREVRKKESEMVSEIQEVLSAIHVVKAFAREEYELRRLAEESRESIRIGLRVRGLKAQLGPTVDMIVAVGTCMVLWIGGRMVLKDALSAGSLVLFIWYLGKMYKPMRDLSKILDAYAKASVGFERIREILQIDGQVRDLPDARRAPQFRGEIELQNVSFSYGPDHPTLKRVSLVIQPGQVVALVGPTGAGKTTIISLIPRFYDPDTGIVKIDGIDVKRLQQESLREQISFVLQETLLFHAPVSYNIAYGKPDASPDEIVRAATLANAHEFIERLPQGYNTIIGERGTMLSGGERQRIAIARAMIRNAPILVLDEASSGLDAVSEKAVFDALDRLMKGKTSIVITHHLSTIRTADVIFVVDNGEIIERGNHAELLKRGGVYARLHDLQFRREGATTQSATTHRDSPPNQADNTLAKTLNPHAAVTSPFN